MPLPEHDQDPQGNVPDRSSVALLLIDVINDLEFDGGEKLAPHALPMARRIAALKQRARRARIPAIYVNDNFGRWQSDFAKLLAHCLEDGVRGQELARVLAPEEDDYFVLKPKNSGFYSTTLDTLLQHLSARTLVLVGVATDLCVLFTANDAHMRGYQLCVPSDCVAANTPARNRHALALLRAGLQADTTPSRELALGRLKRRASRERGP